RRRPRSRGRRSGRGCRSRRTLAESRSPARPAESSRRASGHSRPTCPIPASRTRDTRLPCGGRSRGWSACRPLLLLALGEGQRRRLLGDVRMIGTGVDAQLAPQHLTSERRLWQHTVDRFLDYALGMLGEHRAERRESLVPHVAGVMEVLLLLTLLARHLHL